MAIPGVRMSDVQPCPSATPQPHVQATVLSGSPTVLVVGLPAAHLGSVLVCTGDPAAPNTIVKGSGTVFVCGQGAARTGDSTSHGGVVISGQVTVLIGD